MKKYLFILIALLAAGFAEAEEVAKDLANAEPQKIEEITPKKASDEATAATEATADGLWDAGGTAYMNEKFHEAATHYQALADRGLSSYKLFYNLANAYFKDGRLGKAILYYHRALRLAPGEEDIRYNLTIAEAKLKDTIEEVPEFFLSEWFVSLRRTMSCTAWSIFSLVALAVGLALVLAYLLARSMAWRKVGFYGTLLMALVFVVTTWFAIGERKSILDRTDAVVQPASVSVKSSPDKSATDLFILHEGTPLKIGSRLDGWCEVTIADGKKGWIEEHKIEVI